ncbi:MAG: type I secretion C-terminal target domain-containing protein [Alphaproteobacteria bacterium]|nr:type I secretion C-terminal target domain-containing protein [Alphaproteobacteria bacterium]
MGIVGTDGNDSLHFQGTLGQLTMSITNPFSNEIIDIDDEFRINTTTYDGLGGDDVLYMNNIADALFLVNDAGEQTIMNIETIVAGDGGDVINLAHETVTIGDIIISGGYGDDILWGNVGNDYIRGIYGNDIIDGGPGDDILQGGDGDDRVSGGLGNDTVSGNDGNDILFGGNDIVSIVHDKDFVDSIVFPHLLEGVNIASLVPPGTSALGFAEDNMSVDFDAMATLTFRDGFAGYNNTLGIYSIAEDGTIEVANVLWANSKDAGIDIAHEIDLPVGANGGDFAFFIIADGDRVNNEYDGLDITGEGNIRFVYDFGGAGERAANISDDGSFITIVYDDGVIVQALDGPHYHTTERGESTDINWDGQTHMISGLVDVGQQDVLRIGFEDLPNLGDADYEDVFFDFNVIETITTPASENGDDILEGGYGDDILYGGNGDDILIIGIGQDDVYGGGGNDTFLYEFYFEGIDTLVDTIHDFEMGANNDVLDINDILQDYSSIDDAIEDFVEVTSLNGDTHVYVNVDGADNDFVQILTLTGVDTTLLDMLNSGNLVVEL